ncbi:hypothetical protein J437_LFUL014826 [Ladona fulva]|uniref:Uncharacterized protein n=1 Tax=Ladona fulva TaxID=123851 RepID=A0A8K0KM20_LADFU|nr:hypothetical protein J437_LFUL014826 [Ladona fulva]
MRLLRPQFRGNATINFPTSSSVKSLSHIAVLLHDGNKYPSLPLAHSVYFKEDCNSIKTLQDAV